MERSLRITKKELSIWKPLLKRNPVLFFLLGLVFILPFLDGGVGFLAEFLLLVLPLPLLLLRPSVNFNPFFLAFLFFCFLSLFNSASLALSVPKFFEFLSLFLLFNLFTQFASAKNLKLLVYTILAISFLLCLLSFYYLLPFTNPPKSTMNLVYATHGHNHLAEYLCFALPISLALFIKSKRRKLFFGILVLLYLFSLLFTFSRTSLLFLPLIAFLMIKKLKPKETLTRVLSWHLVVLPLCLLLLISLLSLTEFKPYNWLIRQTVKPLKVEKRLDYWPQAIEAFWQRPFLGWGIGTFRLISQRFQKKPNTWSWFAHNFYLQILSETGIFGFISFLIFLILSLREAWKNLGDRERPCQVGSFFALLFSSLHSLFDFDWDFPAIFLTFFALLAFLVKKKSSSFPLLLLFAFLAFVFGQSMLLGEYQQTLRLYPFSRKNWLSWIKTEAESQRALFFNREDSAIYSLLAEEDEKKGDYQKALTMFEKAISFYPIDPPVWQKLEKIYQVLGQEEKKLALYQQIASVAKKVEPESEHQGYLAKTLYQLGLFYYQKAEWQRTEEYWQEAARLAPQWSYFHVELANLYQEKGDFEKAKAVLEHCLEFYHPKYHCSEYLQKEIKESPGSFQDKILKIPD